MNPTMKRRISAIETKTGATETDWCWSALINVHPDDHEWAQARVQERLRELGKRDNEGVIIRTVIDPNPNRSREDWPRAEPVIRHRRDGVEA